jgi:hypothetical protein
LLGIQFVKIFIVNTLHQFASNAAGF